MTDAAHVAKELENEPREPGFYWVRHIRADAPWQPMEFIGDDCWLATDCDGLVPEASIMAVGPRLTPPEETP